MSESDKIHRACEEHGGIYHCDDFKAIPYNHWKKDNVWLVMVNNLPRKIAFIPVDALTPREAVILAIEIFIEDEDDE